MILFPLQRLIVLRGVERPGKTQLARALAAALPPPSVHLPFADLSDHWIVHPGRDRGDEVALAYRLLKLLAVTYVKEGYSLVVDAPFVDAGAPPAPRDDELRDLLRLARTFRRVQPSLVTLLGDDGSADGREAAALLRRDHGHEDIQIEGEGGDIDGFARQLLERIALG